jgi:hypothetical protein
MDADSLPVEFLGVPVRVSGDLEPDLVAKLGEILAFCRRRGRSQILAFCRR